MDQHPGPKVFFFKCFIQWQKLLFLLLVSMHFLYACSSKIDLPGLSGGILISSSNSQLYLTQTGAKRWSSLLHCIPLWKSIGILSSPCAVSLPPPSPPYPTRCHSPPFLPKLYPYPPHSPCYRLWPPVSDALFITNMSFVDGWLFESPVR